MHPRQQKCSICITRYFQDPVAAIQSFENVSDSYGGTPLRIYSGLLTHLSMSENSRVCLLSIV